MMPRKFTDITGQKFERLTAVRFLRRENKRTFWEFRCDCGRIVSKRIDSVKNGSIKSCGCLHKESTANNGRNSSTKFKKGMIPHNKGKRMEEWLGKEQAKIARNNLVRFGKTAKYQKFNKRHNAKLAEINKNPVVQMTLLGEFVVLHDSVKAAAKAVGREPATISRVCCHRGISSAGYSWQFFEERFPNLILIKNTCSK